jgi:hypothetical protein
VNTKIGIVNSEIGIVNISIGDREHRGPDRMSVIVSAKTSDREPSRVDAQAHHQATR